MKYIKEPTHEEHEPAQVAPLGVGNLYDKLPLEAERPKEKETVESFNPRLRPKTRLAKQKLNLVYNCEGLGGYIQWTTAMQWVYEAHPNLYGKVFCTKIFYDLAKLWYHHLRDRVTVTQHTLTKPRDFVKVFGQNHVMPKQIDFMLFNSLGCHYLRQGFYLFGNIDYIPDGYCKIPRINGDETSIEKFDLPTHYGVITTEATTESRMLHGSTINGLTAFFKKNGLTPVFVGKKKLSESSHLLNEYTSSSPANLNLEGVIDLRDQTSLIEVACILANAQVVVGLDNGLLHLAACSDVPIVWGFNSVDPKHRVPPRSGPVHVVGPPEALPCRFCQSHLRDDRFRDFRKCIYDDFKCLDYLTADLFIAGISALFNTAPANVGAQPGPGVKNS